MGLDTTHDCWHGAYSAFMRWRREIAACIGIDLDRMEGFHDENLHAVWKHDRDKVWQTLRDAIERRLFAEPLEAILPLLPNGDAPGHIGNWRDKTQQFIDGLRLAASRGEDVEFH